MLNFLYIFYFIFSPICYVLLLIYFFVYLFIYLVIHLFSFSLLFTYLNTTYLFIYSMIKLRYAYKNAQMWYVHFMYICINMNCLNVLNVHERINFHFCWGKWVHNTKRSKWFEIMGNLGYLATPWRSSIILLQLTVVVCSKTTTWFSRTSSMFNVGINCKVTLHKIWSFPLRIS